MNMIEKQRILQQKYPYREGDSSLNSHLRLIAYWRELYSDIPQIRDVVKFIEYSMIESSKYKKR